MQQYNFQVNLSGIIEILSKHLYSEERVFLRELLQNATDAITARRSLGDGFSANVQVELIPAEGEAPAQLIMEDNGIGLTEKEVHGFLANIGASSKREELFAKRNEFIGQFGIGLLSCFMVTDEIVMVTSSAKETNALEWRGRADGSYSVRKLEGEYEAGTKVFIAAKQGKGRFFEKMFTRKSLMHFGCLLPFPVSLHSEGVSEMINELRPPWEREFADEALAAEARLQYGREQFDIDFLDVIPLKADMGGAEGLGFILPYETNPSAKPAHKVYLKNMLVSESADNILPDWAFFVRCVINAKKLKPTASRESFYEDAFLNHTRRQLGECLRQYLIDLEAQQPQKLKRLYAIHYHTMNSLALHDDDFFKIIIKYVPFETNLGNLTLPEYEARSSQVSYVTNLDEFRQISGIATAQELLLINSGYTYKTELLEKYGELFPEKKLQVVSAKNFAERFEQLTPTEAERFERFLKVAEAELAKHKCRPLVRKFMPQQVPALFVKDEFSDLWRTLKQSKDVADSFWGGILDSLAEENDQLYSGMICFNAQNELVQQMSDLADEGQMSLYIRVVYVQALLLGHYPLQTGELEILSSGLAELLRLGLR